MALASLASLAATPQEAFPEQQDGPDDSICVLLNSICKSGSGPHGPPGEEVTALHFIWLGVNCTTSQYYKRVTYGEFTAAIYLKFCTYYRKLYNNKQSFQETQAYFIYKLNDIITKYNEMEELLYQQFFLQSYENFFKVFIKFI